MEAGAAAARQLSTCSPPSSCTLCSCKGACCKQQIMPYSNVHTAAEPTQQHRISKRACMASCITAVRNPPSQLVGRCSAPLRTSLVCTLDSVLPFQAFASLALADRLGQWKPPPAHPYQVLSARCGTHTPSHNKHGASTNCLLPMHEWYHRMPYRHCNVMAAW